MSIQDKIIVVAVAQAQKVAQQNGLTIGQTVAIPSDPMTYELLTVDKGMAIIGYKDIQHTVSLAELFDPNVALVLALRIQTTIN